MKSKKVLAVFLSGAILTLSVASAFAANTDNPRPINHESQIVEVMPVKDSQEMPGQSYFGSFTGIVKSIADYEPVKGSKIIAIENSEGIPANVIVSKDTYILNNAEIKVGSILNAFFDANAPMIMIYPAQYNAAVVVIDNKEQNIKVDLFDADLLSADKMLKLNISEATEVMTQDGKAYNGTLGNRNLVVVYGAISKSLPAQTNPIKVIVLNEKSAGVTADVSKMDIVVNDKTMKAPAAYTNSQGVIMVPVRAAGEALGFEVKWNGKESSVSLGNGISLKIGEDYYVYMRTAPIQLGTAPELVKGKTYVPLSFFTEVARVGTAAVMESKIIINSETNVK